MTITFNEIVSAIPHTLNRVDLLNIGTRIQGKVRDIYIGSCERVLISTDRVSVFDRVVGLIPFKGQILNQLSAWWFSQLEDIIPTHVISIPDPNVMIVREASRIPVEVVVRGYLSGSTSTSLWTLYNQGVDKPYGLDLPPWLEKDDKLPNLVITSTTKAVPPDHDEPLIPKDIAERGLVDPDLWVKIQKIALEIFKRGQEIAKKAGLILVDTKYEFGMVGEELILIDEVHTSDSSRYWAEGKDNLDKEFLRSWFAKQGYQGKGKPPVIPDEVIAQVAGRYISAYEKLTGQTFVPGLQIAKDRIEQLFVDFHNQEKPWDMYL